MEIIVKINDIKEIEILDNVDAYLLGNKSFSLRYKHSFSLKEIKEIKDKTRKKIYVLVNKIFFEDELENLKTYLLELKKMDIDKIFFADFAVFTIAKKLNMQNKLVFFHETFLRSSYDIMSYQDLGIENIICSKDMNIEDIKSLPLNKKDNYGIVCFGFMPLYYSKRKILENYIKTYHLSIPYENKDNLTLKEQKRKEHYKVLQQNGNSFIFNADILSYADEINILKEHLTMFIFDCLFFEAPFIKEVINIFFDTNELKQERINKLDEKLTYTKGFLIDKVGLI